MPKLNVQDLINRMNGCHRKYYNYSKWTTNDRYVPDTIICPVHGEFQLSYRQHYYDGKICPGCDSIPEPEIPDCPYPKWMTDLLVLIAQETINLRDDETLVWDPFKFLRQVTNGEITTEELDGYITNARDNGILIPESLEHHLIEY